MDITKVIILVLLFLIISLYGYDFYQQCYINLEQEYYIFMNYSDKHCHLELAKKYHFGSDKIKINYPKAFELYNKAIENKDNVAYIYLAQLYSDIHDIDSSIIYYNKSIEKGYFQCFINLGDIYFYEKNHIDLELAELNYKAAIKYSTFTDAKVEANNKLKILQIEKTDNYYNSEETEIDFDIDTLMKYGIDIIEEERPVPGFRELINQTENKNYIKKEVRKNDRQNVHDHVVSNTVKNSVENLIQHTTIFSDKPQSLIDIRKFILLKTKSSEPHSPASSRLVENIEEKNDNQLALKVLDHIEISTVKYRNTELLETDLLHLVWNRIHNECNKERIEELKDNLYCRLLECNEDETKVCASGIFSRLIDTLNYCDAENIVEIIPKYVLNKELMIKSASISKKFQNDQTEEIQVLLEKIDLNSEEKKKTKDYIERLKLKLVSEFRKDYIDSNIISEDILFLEINKWIDYI